MNLRPVVIAILFALPLTGWAELPNIEPGMWEYRTTTKIESEFPFPDQSDTSTDCVTQEDIEQGDALLDLEDMDECDVTRKDLRRNGATFALSCQGMDGFEMNMTAEMEFRGNTSAAVIRGDMQTPMGPMKMHIDMEGRRIGDC